MCIIFSLRNVYPSTNLNEIEQLLRVEKPSETIDCILILKNIIKEKDLLYFKFITKATTQTMTNVYTKYNKGCQVISHCWVTKPQACLNVNMLIETKSLINMVPTCHTSSKPVIDTTFYFLTHMFVLHLFWTCWQQKLLIYDPRTLHFKSR